MRTFCERKGRPTRFLTSRRLLALQPIGHPPNVPPDIDEHPNPFDLALCLRPKTSSAVLSIWLWLLYYQNLFWPKSAPFPVRSRAPFLSRVVPRHAHNCPGLPSGYASIFNHPLAPSSLNKTAFFFLALVARHSERSCSDNQRARTNQGETNARYCRRAFDNKRRGAMRPALPRRVSIQARRSRSLTD